VDVALTSVVTVTFSEAMDASTIDGTSFELRDSTNTVVPSSVAYDTGSSTATLTPDVSLLEGTTYTVTVQGGASGATDAAGNALAADESWSFTTVAPADTTPPTVTGQTPADGATDVAVTSVVTVTFSEAMDAGTIDASSVELRDSDNNLVPSTVTYDAGSQTATLTPDASLSEETTYTVTVQSGANGVTDTAGNALDTDVSWSFTTTESSG
jgi:hypothetical protein